MLSDDAVTSGEETPSKAVRTHTPGEQPDSVASASHIRYSGTDLGYIEMPTTV